MGTADYPAADSPAAPRPYVQAVPPTDASELPWYQPSTWGGFHGLMVTDDGWTPICLVPFMPDIATEPQTAEATAALIVQTLRTTYQQEGHRA